jgi:hypothetical protein
MPKASSPISASPDNFSRMRRYIAMQYSFQKS